MLRIGDTFTWKPSIKPSDQKSKTGFYVDDWINTYFDNPYVSGDVVFNDSEIVIIKVSDMSPFMFPFTLFRNEVENRTDYRDDKETDIFQKYICLHIGSMASLFYFDEENCEIVEALFDDENQFLGYDVDVNSSGEEPENAPDSDLSFCDKIEILLPSDEIEKFKEDGTIIEQDEAYEEFLGEFLTDGDSDTMLITSNPYKVQRARKWLNNTDCAIVTAWRSGNSRRENDENNRKLQQTLRKYGYGVAKVRGCYTEMGKETNKENSFLTFDLISDSYKFRDNVYRLSEKYDQDCFLYKEAGYDIPAVLIGTNDDFGKGKIKLAGRMHFGNMSAKEYSEIGSGRITFE